MRSDISAWLERQLEEAGAIRFGHFGYTKDSLNGKGDYHGPYYLNIGELASNANFFDICGDEISGEANVLDLEVDVVLGPETLGRTLAQAVARRAGKPYLWVDMGEDENKQKVVVKAKRQNYDRFLKPGVRVLIVDELINNGSTVEPLIRFLRPFGVEIVGVAAIARRQQSVTASKLGVPELIVLYDVMDEEADIVYAPGECELCAEGIPIDTDVGYGKAWASRNPEHPSARAAN